MAKRSNINKVILSLNKAYKNKLLDQDKIIKTLVISTLTSMIISSPVISGLYRANHTIALNNPFVLARDSVDHTSILTNAEKTLSDISLVEEDGYSIFIVNPLIYASKVEDNHKIFANANSRANAIWAGIVGA